MSKCLGKFFHDYGPWRNRFPILGDQSSFQVRECQTCGIRKSRWLTA